MSHQSMSINQILQPKETTIEKKLTSKDDFKDRKWVGVPLKKCLTSVCSSCPDQLMNSNTAIYSANFEESATVENWSPLHDSRSNIIWEGHGTLNAILNDDQNDAQVTGKLTEADKGGRYDCYVEVLIQLHPIVRHPMPNKSDNQHYLPPMRSLWNNSSEYPSSANSSPPSHHHHNNTSPTLQQQQSRQQHQHQLASPSPPHRQLNALQFPMQRDDVHRLPSFNVPSSSSFPREMHKDDHHHPTYPPALDPDWPGSRYDSSSFDQEMIKRRKLSPPNQHQQYRPHLSPSSSSPSHRQQQQQHDSNTKLMNNHLTVHRHPSSSSKPSAIITTSPHSNSNSAMATTRLNSTTTDTYYHQSRRKKRDTKPPNANDIRPFVEVERAKDGSYVLPAEVDSWTVLSLGTVVWDKAAFHNQRYIYPVGYRVKKWYRSMVDPHSDTQYTCEILDGGDEPIFQLNADDNPSECWRGPTPTTVWTIAVRRAFAIRNMDYGHNPVGPDFFGLRKNTIAKMIQDLPNADKCKNYIWQNFEAMSNNKGKSVRRTNARLSSSSSTGSTTNNDKQLESIDENAASSPSTVKSEGA
ncbi:hypothetical protein FB192DRAFT_1436956 [Mucor lusitanicus]|uniref:Uncharacterized protein n=2 Tax=Mucor circinelloides f. lusitanicus TaxID=29924 RepID=A0A168IC86_MUCCL|nr:hypothetical protein FB192DRAFT_1436956 [Mucor lusitanicus]OAC99798.1 hypothetical protein MUCCIDRAFT_165625 [Mucor lusitanicus CBS 277.49]